MFSFRVLNQNQHANNSLISFNHSKHIKATFVLPAAPEMLKGDVVGPPADIWSVGVLTFIM